MIYIIHQYLYIFNSKIDENKGVRNKMIIIGIDPGYAIVGIGVVEYVGNKFRTLEYNTCRNADCRTFKKEIYGDDDVYR